MKLLKMIDDDAVLKDIVFNSKKEFDLARISIAVGKSCFLYRNGKDSFKLFEICNSPFGEKLIIEEKNYYDSLDEYPFKDILTESIKSTLKKDFTVYKIRKFDKEKDNFLKDKNNTIAEVLNGRYLDPIDYHLFLLEWIEDLQKGRTIIHRTTFNGLLNCLRTKKLEVRKTIKMVKQLFLSVEILHQP
jgi:hypothetical protein